MWYMRLSLLKIALFFIFFYTDNYIMIKQSWKSFPGNICRFRFRKLLFETWLAFHKNAHG